MVGSFLFSVRLPFPMVSFFGFHRGLMRSVCFFLSFAFRWLLGRLRFSSSVFPLGGSCRSSVPRFPLLIRSHPFHGFVFPPPFPFLIRFPFSGFPFVFVFLLPSFSFAWLACPFPFRGFDRGSSLFRLSVFRFHVRPFSPLHCDAPPGGGGWAYRPRSSASSRRASSRVAWRRWSR